MLKNHDQTGSKESKLLDFTKLQVSPAKEKSKNVLESVQNLNFRPGIQIKYEEQSVVKFWLNCGKNKSLSSITMFNILQTRFDYAHCAKVQKYNRTK